MSPDLALDPVALETLLSLEREQPGAFSEFVRLFVTEAPPLVRRIEQAYAARDIDELRHAAHYLRSASLALGATGLSAISQAVEKRDPATFGSAEADAELDLLRHRVRDSLIALLQAVPKI